MNIRKKIAAVIFSALMIFVAVICVLYYDMLKEETAHSVKNCISVIIPSLYGSMLLSCIITESGLHFAVGKIFSRISRYIFRIPPEIFPVFLISNISGYPVGAKILNDFRNKKLITDSEYNRYIRFCFSSGPAFITGTAALSLYNSATVGLIIFVSVSAANLMLAFLSGIGKPVPQKSGKKTQLCFNTKTITDSVNNATSGTLNMCTMITAFSIVKTVFIKSGLISFLSEKISSFTSLSSANSRAFIFSMLEISAVSQFEKNNFNNIPVLAFLLSFGGFCVFLQIISISENTLRAAVFLAYRTAGAAVSFFICRIILGYFITDISVTASAIKIHSPEYPMLPSILLLFMTILLISQKSYRQTEA